MRKILFITLLFVLVAAVPAMAATNGPHGNYNADTDSCSACHETHAAEGVNLFRFASSNVSQNCYYCHGASKIGSVYDAQGGFINGTASDFKANGGGFEQTGVTSMHNVETAQVSQGPGSAMEVGGTFTCASCHSAHGTASDRLLVTSRTTVQPDGPDPDTNPDVFIISVGANFDITVNNEKQQETITYLAGSNAFCGLCHYDYDTSKSGAPAHTGDATSGMYSSKYRHKVGVNATTAPKYDATHGLPLENTNILTCLTCHKAHSTTAVGTGTYMGDGSALLRYDKRAVCIACHRWNSVTGAFTPR